MEILVLLWGQKLMKELYNWSTQQNIDHDFDVKFDFVNLFVYRIFLFF
jgi:hypothetical protein